MAHTIPLTVRSYELDSLGHVNQAVYHQYAEFARMEMLNDAKFDGRAIEGKNIGPVLLEATMKYQRELRLGDSFEIRTTAEFGERKVFRMGAEFVKSDGTIAATFDGVFGFLDLDKRKLMPIARDVINQCCQKPEIMLG